jgi:hypothetical protein
MTDTHFNHDVFISYAHIDNGTISEEQQGWITILHRALELRLSQLLGKKPKIWRDLKLQGNDEFDEEIVSKLITASVLVAVLSPPYVSSDWCIKEIKQFIEATEQSGGIHINNKSRIFKVVKTPTPPEKHPVAIQGLLGYEFFHLDPETRRFLEFNQVFGRDLERKFWAKLEDLALDISYLLEIMWDRPIASPLLVPPSDITVYLAETTSDLSFERDQIRRELHTRGHTILPDQPLPLSGPELESVVREHLKRCAFSIHLIGGVYGIVPELADRSIVELQNMLAAEHSQQYSSFARLLWLPIDLQVKDTRQEAFISALRNDPALQPGDDLLQTSLEDLKTAIQDKLALPGPEEGAEEGTGLTRIYLIYDQRDLEKIVPLEDYLYDQKFEVLRPLFDGDAAEVSEEHLENLRICDAVLIYHGQANEAWLRGKLRDLRKAPGYGRAAPILAKAIYVADPEDRQKARFRSHEVDVVIKNFGDFSPDTLEPFLTKLAQKGEQD